MNNLLMKQVFEVYFKSEQFSQILSEGIEEVSKQEFDKLCDILSKDKSLFLDVEKIYVDSMVNVALHFYKKGIHDATGREV